MKIIAYCHADARLNGGLILYGQFVEKLTESLVLFEQIDLQIEIWDFFTFERVFGSFYIYFAFIGFS